jgi:small multidrug resistance pump
MFQQPGEVMHWVYLLIAIVAEVIATSALKASAEFTRLVPSVVVVVGYLTAFYFLSLTLRTLPVAIVYAMWSGIGIALIALVGWLFLKQSLDAAALIGIGLIVSGVLVLNVFSKTVAH